MDKKHLEQCYAIEFCVKLREGAIDTYEMIQKAFRNDSLSRGQVYVSRWHREFVNGREAVDDEPRDLEPPPTSVRTSKDVDRVRAFICQDRCFDNTSDFR
jgi:hypothetical protein